MVERGVEREQAEASGNLVKQGRSASPFRETVRRLVLGLGFAVLFLAMWWRCG